MHHRAIPLIILAAASPTLAQGPDLVDRIGRAAGRLHPLAVHFPIGLIVTACLIELYRGVRRKPEASPTALTCLSIGAFGACVAALFGWLNASYEVASSSTVELHRWLGIALAAFSIALAAFGLIIRRSGPSVRVFRLGLVIAAGLVAYGGHLGGVLTHGENYITGALRDVLAPRTASPPANTSTNPQQQTPAPPPATLADIRFPADGTIDFARDVRPIFTLSCIECHGENKKKGALRMDHKSAALAGGKNGPLYIPGKPDESQLIIRILGLGEEQRMPQDRDALPDDCIRILQKWVAEGAHWPDDAP